MTQYRHGVARALLYILLLQGCQSQLYMTPEEGANISRAVEPRPLQGPSDVLVQVLPAAPGHAIASGPSSDGQGALQEDRKLPAKRQKIEENVLPLLATAPGDNDFLRRPYDVFISHAGEDKKTIAAPLYEALTARGVTAFFDREELRLGENAPAHMISAMESALCGVFILSPEFLAKKWPMKELCCFLERQEAATKRNGKLPNLLPVFYRLSYAECNEPGDLFDRYSDVFEKHGFNARMYEGETNRKKVRDALQRLSKYTGKEVIGGEAPSQWVSAIADALCGKVEELRDLHASKGLRSMLASHYSTSPYFTQIPRLFVEEGSRHISELACAPLHRMVPSEVRGQEAKRQLIDQSALFSNASAVGSADNYTKVLVIGNPGTGKTTLSKQLAYRWSQGAWGSRFAFVYVLPVRNLYQDRYDGSNYRQEATLSTAIVNNCFTVPEEEERYQYLRRQVRETLASRSTLVILDGLDERSGALSESCETLIARAETGPHSLLMLSRGYNIKKERGIANAQIALSGFSDAQVRTYVNETLNSDQSASLLAKFAEHPQIFEITRVPVNLEILCTLWGSVSDSGRIAQELDQGSLPGLYREVTAYIWERYVEDKLDKLPGYADKSTRAGIPTDTHDILFDVLSELAWLGLTETRPIDATLVRRVVTGSFTRHLTVLQDSGFLLLKHLPGSNQYEFPHLTFQEYFAGRWLAKQLFSDDEEAQEAFSAFLKKPENKYKDSYGPMLTFMAGEAVHMQSKKAGRSRLRKFLDLTNAGVSTADKKSIPHLRLQMRLLNEWLCVSSAAEIEAGLPELEQISPIRTTLPQQFRKRIYELEEDRYNTHLPLLTQLLSDFRSVAKHTAPGCLAIVLNACSSNHRYIRNILSSTLISVSQLAREECLAQLKAATGYVDENVGEVASAVLADLTRVLAPLQPFGPEEWKKYFGVTVDAAPALPSDLEAILESPCPFRLDRQVKETHLLFLAPASVGSVPFTLNKLGELIKPNFPDNQGGYHYCSEVVESQYGDQKHPAAPCWLLLTRDILPGSRGMTLTGHQELLSHHSSKGYRLPHVLEAAVGMLTHYVRTRERLYGDGPRIYTRCAATQLVDGKQPIVVVGFEVAGLAFDHYYALADHGALGVTGCRKL